MQIQLEVQKALDDTGRKLAVCAAAVSSDGAALPGIAEALLLREMADRTEAETYITGGKFGISLIGSDFSGEEITLRAAYHIRLPIRIFWLWDFAMEQRADCRKWTGWSAAEGSDEDQWVYVTQTGTVYHREYSCTHLERRSGLWRRRKLRHFAMRTGKHIENACSAGMRKMHSDGSILRTRATATTKILAAAASSEPSA